jgi:hypothetical protein
MGRRRWEYWVKSGVEGMVEILMCYDTSCFCFHCSMRIHDAVGCLECVIFDGNNLRV